MTKVFLRPRPLAASEQGDDLVRYEFNEASKDLHVVPSAKSFKHFAGILSPDNTQAYAQAIRPLLPEILAGRSGCCFAYGHTNSGKTHTIFGYGEQPGMYKQAVDELFASMDDGLLMQVRFYELYNGKVYDLLNNRQPGFVREDADGVIHVRSETTMGPNGEVLTQSLHAVYGDSADFVLDVIRSSAKSRAEGTSELHSQSSRSHAVLELEIVSSELARARQDVVVAKSKVVPLGKARDDTYIAIQMKTITMGPDGKYVHTGVAIPKEDTERLEELERQVQAAESVVKAAEARVDAAKPSTTGGMLVFVDLAGAEYTGEGLKRNSAEMREAKEINVSLLALKECIRAQAIPGRTPYRNSKLTMLLKGHLDAANTPRTVMIANVSSSAALLSKATNTIKYAALVADAFQGAF
ncbi:hypothetical protein Poli38472_003818 [Pythium oligandrum]|uniref:Kinesin motor domain-containing protein n=1 Tax=Pythium oligandrum TaxID=41045 RepID=A0A8K1CPJ8_PYTOL|nr:hypothetical protein Poli38472_003818 [Pythium oligandrum]|eukprot:TMW66053.1 hypothetical protein Poli38472_003818 [Pythium oligandrum]